MYSDNFKTIDNEMDTFDDSLNARNTQKGKASRKRKNDVKKKIRRKRLVEKSGNPGVGWLSQNKEGGEYVKLPKNSNKQRYLKKQTHRRNRRKPIAEDDYARKGNSYRKSLDYFWELD